MKSGSTNEYESCKKYTRSAYNLVEFELIFCLTNFICRNYQELASLPFQNASAIVRSMNDTPITTCGNWTFDKSEMQVTIVTQVKAFYFIFLFHLKIMLNFLFEFCEMIRLILKYLKLTVL